MMAIACECNCGPRPSFTQSCSKRRLLPVECAVMHYGWGRLGTASLVARMSTVFHGERIKEHLPYAEMWLGAVENAAAARVTTETFHLLEMSAWMERRYWSKSSLYRKFKLPFLFKLLSVHTTLSIQAHPDKQLARRLHAADPLHYRDDNHKPELACALGEFEVLCGFRPKEQIVRAVRSCPELLALVGRSVVDSLERSSEGSAARKPTTNTLALCELFTKLMNSPDESVAKAVQLLARRLQVGAASEEEMLVERLLKQYPGDVGVFCAYLLNHIKLTDGEAIFLPANEPHAYLQGDCVECMACSDNVVRAGLTPKWKDVDTLCSMLTYRMARPEILPGVDEDCSKVTLYRPPVPEFQLRRIRLRAGEKCNLLASSSVGILVCCEGKGFAIDSTRHRYTMRAGFTMLVLPDTTISFDAISDLLVFCCQEQTGADRDKYLRQGDEIKGRHTVPKETTPSASSSLSSPSSACHPVVSSGLPPSSARSASAPHKAPSQAAVTDNTAVSKLSLEIRFLREQLEHAASRQRWLVGLSLSLGTLSIGMAAILGAFASRRRRG